ncbi:class I SAM-dependent methyltransferase [Cesiribacter sp. SM1]|uniref:class I SAM-dependent DNA methyltransferase n=1 Tax=Cesiribacter sp. SM1 TaxID=2861196 RepID=UPI001CD5E4B3|nr:class I SAM-dependent methyltransferase [Cesiribacter sp. SM1]
MDVKQAYNLWAQQYDTNVNKTRDLEALALRTVLARIDFSSCLEIGCGTGKNTAWLITKARELMAVDLSEEMLQKAKEKIAADAVVFQQADITKAWQFTSKKWELISFSLVLEHIQDLEHIFSEASRKIAAGGYIYIGELHPFKQYTGSKARFDTEEGQQVVSCFNHHVTDFTGAAKKWGFEIADISEYFDDNDRNTIPRILSLLLKKS